MEQVSSRGHHSGVARAIEAHRQQIEDRQMRRLGRDFSPMGVSQPSTQYLVANQVQQQGETTEGAVAAAEEEQKQEQYNAPMLEPAASAARASTVWSFQNSEPGRPSMTDIPKGSYLDVKG